jgi:hypothetical protein
MGQRAVADEVLRSEELTKKWTLHVHDLVVAFAVGTLQADPWTKHYSVPPDFHEVLNTVASGIQETYPDEVINLTLSEAETLLWETAQKHPSFQQWNEIEETTGSTIKFITRYDPLQEKRDFISLRAIMQNAVSYLRKEWRAAEEFGKDSGAKYGDRPTLRG